MYCKVVSVMSDRRVYCNPVCIKYQHRILHKRLEVMCEIKEVVHHQQQERHHRLLSLLDHSLPHLLPPIRNMYYIHHNILFFNYFTNKPTEIPYKVQRQRLGKQR